MRFRLAAFRALLVHQLSLARGGRVVVSGASFRIDPGEAVQITGPNGAGKSSLLRALAGLLPAVSGTVGWSPAEPDAPPVAEQAHYVGHADGLKTALTARENLAFSAALAGAPAEAGALSPEAALGRLELGHVAELPVAYLSAGQRRRVALARLLVARRPLWLLDEPATALDAISRTALTGIMADHLRTGGLIAAATHAPLGLAARSLELAP